MSIRFLETVQTHIVQNISTRLLDALAIGWHLKKIGLVNEFQAAFNADRDDEERKTAGRAFHASMFERKMLDRSRFVAWSK
jgi:hypothetical protein